MRRTNKQHTQRSTFPPQTTIIIITGVNGKRVGDDGDYETYKTNWGKRGGVEVVFCALKRNTVNTEHGSSRYLQPRWSCSETKRQSEMVKWLNV